MYFGAVGNPALVPDHIAVWGLLINFRRWFDLYVNLRPVRLFEGMPCPLAGRKPGDIDYVVIRENTEGEYGNVGGRMFEGTEREVVTQLASFSRKGIDRIMKYAFELARTRKKHVTSCTKSNGITITMPYWDERFAEMAKKYPDVRTDQYHVDGLTIQMVLNPDRFDVIVASNLFGDILSDLGPATAGTIGIAASGNINPERSAPSIFEPVHGSAPDIAGKKIANPIATIWSGALMLEHLGHAAAAADIVRAIERVILEGPHTPDMKGKATHRRGRRRGGRSGAQPAAKGRLKRYRIASIPGDGIGNEVIPAGIEVLKHLASKDGFDLSFETFDWSSKRYKETGAYIPEGGLEQAERLRRHLLRRRGRARCARPRLALGPAPADLPGLRPVRQREALAPAAGDRRARMKNARRDRLGHRAREHRGRVFRRRRPRPPRPARSRSAIEVSTFTRTGVERVHRFAFELARKRPRKHLTLVTKSNAQRHGMVLWDEIFFEISAEYPDVTHGSDPGRCRHHAHGAQARGHRRDGRLQPARRHPVGPRRGALRLARHRADGEPESRAPLPVDVRADPRLGLRHHRQGHRQPDRHLLDRLDDARAPGRGGRRRAPHGRDREGHGEKNLHARPRRPGAHARRDRTRCSKRCRCLL